MAVSQIITPTKRQPTRQYGPFRDKSLAKARFIARWIAFLGFAVALLLLLSSRYIEGILLVFPLWVLLISLYILIDNLRRPSPAAVTTLENEHHE
jgi:hypothetical protein